MRLTVAELKELLEDRLRCVPPVANRPSEVFTPYFLASGSRVPAEWGFSSVSHITLAIERRTYDINAARDRIDGNELVIYDTNGAVMVRIGVDGLGAYCDTTLPNREASAS